MFPERVVSKMRPDILCVLIVSAYVIQDTIATPRPKRAISNAVYSAEEPISKLLDSSLPDGRLQIGLRQDYLLQDCTGDGLKQSFPDIDYSLFGYNVLKGFPLADGHDPGFTLPIFTADYSERKHTSDCRFSLPKGFVVVPDVSCDISFSSKVTQTSSEYESHLSVSANVGGGGWGVSFSASAGYNRVTSSLSTGQSVYIITSASCTQYFCKLLPGAVPALHPVFDRALNRLRSTDDEKVYFNFFDTFGTHFPTMVTYGARFSQEYKMTSKTYKKQLREGVNVGVSASYSGLFSVDGGFNMDASQRQQASEFQKSVETRTVTVGASPPSNGDAMTWASSVKNNPVPVKYQLESIENIFSYLVPNTVQNVTKVIDNIKKYKSKYCREFIKQGIVKSCAEPIAGFGLKDTELRGHIRKTLNSTFSECMFTCLITSGCVAFDYDTQAPPGSPYTYKVCFMYGYSTNIRRNIGWQAYIFLDKLTVPLKFHNISIVDTPMSLDPTTKNVNENACYHSCKTDPVCVGYTYDSSGASIWRCRMYGKRMITEVKSDNNAVTTFIGILPV